LKNRNHFHKDVKRGNGKKLNPTHFKGENKEKCNVLLKQKFVVAAKEKHLILSKLFSFKSKLYCLLWEI